MSERFFEYDQAELDASKIEEYEHDIFGPVTVFKDVVIAREIVHTYKDGNAYKPASELEDAFWTADGMWAIANGHPDTAVIMERDQMQGKTVNPRFTKSLIDPKTRRTNNRGIIVDLEIFNNKVPPEILDDMKNGKRQDVSIGFFFNKDETPGIIEEDGHPLKGMKYDFVQRKIAINHTAFALEKGRCPMPFCGVGADEIGKHIANDPFAGFKNHAECVAKNQDKDDAEAYCADIKRKSEGDSVNETLNAFPAVREMDVRLTAENIQIAEATNQVNLATAKVVKHLQGIPRREQARIIAEASLRAKGDSAVVAWTKKVIAEVQKGNLKLSEDERQKLQEQLDKLIHKIAETYTVIDAVQKQGLKTAEKSHNSIVEYVKRQDSVLATDIAKKTRLIKKQATELKALNRRVLQESTLNKKQCATINSLKERATALEKQVGEAGKQFKELERLRSEFNKMKEQEDAKPEPCPEGQHRNDKGECVPDEEPEAVKELKKKLTETLVRVDNLEGKRKGNFKAIAPKLKETIETGYDEDPRKTGHKRK